MTSNIYQTFIASSLPSGQPTLLHPVHKDIRMGSLTASQKSAFTLCMALPLSTDPGPPSHEEMGPTSGLINICPLNDWLDFFPIPSTPSTHNLQLHKCLVRLPFKSLDLLPQWRYEYKTKALFGNRVAPSHEMYKAYICFNQRTACSKRKIFEIMHSSTRSYTEVLSDRAGGTEPSYAETYFVSRERVSVTGQEEAAVGLTP